MALFSSRENWRPSAAAPLCRWHLIPGQRVASVREGFAPPTCTSAILPWRSRASNRLWGIGVQMYWKSTSPANAPILYRTVNCVSVTHVRCGHSTQVRDIGRQTGTASIVVSRKKERARKIRTRQRL